MKFQSILIERTFCVAAIQPFHGKKKPLKYFAALGKRLKASRGSNCNEIKHRAQLFQAVLHLVWREALKLANEFII